MLQKSTEKRLSPGQIRSIPCILSTSSIDQAAKKAKVSRGTIIRWMKLPHFKKIVEDRRMELFEAGLNKLRAATDKAADVLIALLDSRHEIERRLSAKDILNFSFKSIETQDILERIEAIEQILEKRFIS